MTLSKTLLPCLLISLSLAACGDKSGDAQTQDKSSAIAASAPAEEIVWEDLLPAGEDDILTELYAEFYADKENVLRNQMPLSQAGKAETDIMSMIEEGSANDTMEQIGTYNVVADLDGKKIRLPGYVVPIDFNAESQYTEFLLVPYFGACLHTPPPPPNQIIFVRSAQSVKVDDIFEPVWIEGIVKTGKFGSELGNSAYEVTLDKLEPYEY